MPSFESARVKRAFASGSRNALWPSRNPTVFGSTERDRVSPSALRRTRASNDPNSACTISDSEREVYFLALNRHGFGNTHPITAIVTRRTKRRRLMDTAEEEACATARALEGAAVGGGAAGTFNRVPNASRARGRLVWRFDGSCQCDVQDPDGGDASVQRHGRHAGLVGLPGVAARLLI